MVKHSPTMAHKETQLYIIFYSNRSIFVQIIVGFSWTIYENIIQMNSDGRVWVRELWGRGRYLHTEDWVRRTHLYPCPSPRRKRKLCHSKRFILLWTLTVWQYLTTNLAPKTMRRDKNIPVNIPPHQNTQTLTHMHKDAQTNTLICDSSAVCVVV